MFPDVYTMIAAFQGLNIVLKIFSSDWIKQLVELFLLFKKKKIFGISAIVWKASLLRAFFYDTQFLIHLQSNIWPYEWHILLDDVLDVSWIHGGDASTLLQVRVTIQKIKMFYFHFAQLYLIKSSTNTPQYSSLVNNGSWCFQRVVLWHWYCLRYAPNFFSIRRLVHRFDDNVLGFFKYLQVVPNSTIMPSSIFRATI